MVHELCVCVCVSLLFVQRNKKSGLIGFSILSEDGGLDPS